MAFKHGKSTKVAYGGSNLTSYFNEASASGSAEVAQTTVFGQTSHTYVVGLIDGTVSVSGLFDGSANAVDESLQTTLGVEDQHVLILPGGDDNGGRALFAQVETTSYEVSSPIGDVVSVSAEFQGDGGVHSGVYLRGTGGDATFESYSAGATSNGASSDGGEATTNGGVGQVHVMNNSLSVTATVKVQHSTDGSTWVDLITFGTVGAGTDTAEQASVTGTVNRYVRSVVTSPAGTGTAEVAVAFKRNS